MTYYLLGGLVNVSVLTNERFRTSRVLTSYGPCYCVCVRDVYRFQRIDAYHNLTAEFQTPPTSK